jgi:ABC-type polysaccharide/polyol phosphate transport system ATPase subunit
MDAEDPRVAQPTTVEGTSARPSLQDTEPDSSAPGEFPVVVALEQVSSVFCDSLSLSSQYAAADLLNPLRLFRRSQQLRPREFYALQDINLEIRRNETLGVTGTYRSGKSTLANLIGGLYRPTFGKITVSGKTLLINSIGSGFRPMLDLWENVLFRAVLLGAPRQGLEERCREIIAFAELTGQEKTQLFNLDPISVKRIGMATSLFIDADILIFDGLLGAGDMEFKEKSFALACERIRNRTAVIVTHDTDILSQLADRVLVLDEGKVVAMGPPEEALAVFEYGLESGRRRFVASSSSEEEDEDEDEDEDGGLGLDAGIDGAAQTSDGVLVGAVRESSPVRPAKVRPIKQRDIRGEIVHVSVRGRPEFERDYSPLFWPNETVELEMTYTAFHPFTFDEIRVGIHQPQALLPLAAFTVSVRSLFGGHEEMRIKTGEQLKMKCSVIMPNLFRGHYGLALAIAPKGQRVCKKDISKILVFQLRTEPSPGAGLQLEIPHINASLVTERPLLAGEQPASIDGEDSLSSPAIAPGTIVHGKEPCHVERGLSGRAENG